jgi:hypothetical protein
VDWQTMADGQLGDLAERAEAASPRRSRPSKASGPEEGGKRE